MDELDKFVASVKEYAGKVIHVVYKVNYTDTRLFGPHEGKELSGFYFTSVTGELTSIDRINLLLTSKLESGRAQQVIQIPISVIEDVTDTIPVPKNKLVKFAPCKHQDAANET